MQTILLEQPGQLRQLDREKPGEPEPGEALVRIYQVGAYGTNSHAYQGNQPFFRYPRILGHELGVAIVAIGKDEQQVAVKARCAIEPYIACGHCPACQRGKPNCCLHLQVLGVHIDGGMREFAHMPIRSLHPSSNLSYEPLAIGAHAVARAQLQARERDLLVAGPIGLAITQCALLA